MSLNVNIAPLLEYSTLLMLTVILTAFSFSVKEAFWGTALKLAAGLFWFVMAIGQFLFFGADNTFMILCVPFSVFGLLFFVSIVKDSLSVKKHRQWDFDD